jgi:hypothetical protein
MDQKQPKFFAKNGGRVARKALKTPFRNFFPYTKRPDLPSRKLLMVSELELDVCLVSHDAYYRNQKRASNYPQRYLN